LPPSLEERAAPYSTAYSDRALVGLGLTSEDIGVLLDRRLYGSPDLVD